MSQIQVLDNQTIDKIAAGEVVERPMSVVKELVENAIDACASAITIEIKNGGISLIRVTDNGIGIEKNQISTAFLRHATSKIRSVEDLLCVSSLGFRGEALSSIAAVAKVELLSKTKNSVTGTRYVIEGAREMTLEDVGVPEGTTFFVRDLFYNTPARRKFLKSAMTEGIYITELVEHMMLSHPEIAFKLVVNGNCKLQSSGNRELKDAIYQVYGRDMTAGMVPIEVSNESISVTGFVGKPELARNSRSYEVYYVNQRYLKSPLISKALDEAYKQYLMLHKYPFVVLHLTVPSELIDINVHPTKMEIRFFEGERIYQVLVEAVKEALSRKELIPKVYETKLKLPASVQKEAVMPEPFEINRKSMIVSEKIPTYRTVSAESETEHVKEELKEQAFVQKPEQKSDQISLFEPQFLSKEAVKQHHIIGQLFETYWLVEMQDKLYIIDQHAAHEKVIYERLMKKISSNSVSSQMLNPPIIISLSSSEEQLLTGVLDNFCQIGFEIEHFGGSEYSIRAVPTELFGLTAATYFHEMFDELTQEHLSKGMDSINDRIATMACKSAVKGNNSLSDLEAKMLIDELLTLDNPYNCPHGRPTIIAYSKYEIEKKFKRIL